MTYPDNVSSPGTLLGMGMSWIKWLTHKGGGKKTPPRAPVPRMRKENRVGSTGKPDSAQAAADREARVGVESILQQLSNKVADSGLWSLLELTALVFIALGGGHIQTKLDRAHGLRTLDNTCLEGGRNYY